MSVKNKKGRSIESHIEKNRESSVAAIEGSNDGVWDWNVVTNEVYFSDRWKEMLEYKPSEIKNNFDAWRKLVHKDDLTKALEEIDKALKNITPNYVLEHRLRAKDGSYKWILARGKVLERDKEGKPLRMVGTHTDISDLKKAERMLIESESKYRALVENSPVLIMTTDAKEVIQFINFTGGTRRHDEVIGHSLYNFVDKEYASIVKAAHKSVFKNKTVHSYETLGIDGDGAKIWFQTHVGPILMGEKVVGLTMFTRDITERKIAEAKILQSLKEKEVLLKEIHHRVKNNLQIISSILSLQANFIKDKKSAEMVRDIQGRIKSMSVIHDLLYQSKNFNNINFAEYLEIVIVNITHSFSPIERTKKELNAPALDLKIENLYLDLEVAIPCGLIVNELITNSIKYAFSTQKKPVIHLSLKKEKNLITLIVQDNGKGLPPKLDIRNSKSLGLQLVTSLVEQLDGKLKVESKTGAKFTITFSIK